MSLLSKRRSNTDDFHLSSTVSFIPVVSGFAPNYSIKDTRVCLKLWILELALEPATMLYLLMCSTPLGGRHSMQDDREINRYYAGKT